MLLEKQADSSDQCAIDSNHVSSLEPQSSYEQDNEVILPDDNEKEHPRNLFSFWILGLCNNFGYVIMLSAAFDLLSKDYHDDENQIEKYNSSNETICNNVSTAAVLLADIIPSLCIKFLAPFIGIRTNSRVFIVVFLGFLSFIVTAQSVSNGMTFFGVALCSLSSGLGEVTFLSYSSYYHKNVVSTWSSGTGGAGVAGALLYSILRMRLNPRNTLLAMLIVPFLMVVTFFVVLKHPPALKLRCKSLLCNPESEPMIGAVDLSTNETVRKKSYSWQQKAALIKPLLKYMIPLSIVYFAEYFINQGLMELLYFKKIYVTKKLLTHKEQYHWYQVTYQIGVLISRSSVNLIRIRHIWILPVLQIINLVILLLQVLLFYIPSIWIVFAFILYEGLIGGSAYVNVFYEISTKIAEEDREFSMGIASLADTIGIALAGLAAIPTHDAICKLPAYAAAI